MKNTRAAVDSPGCCLTIVMNDFLLSKAMIKDPKLPMFPSDESSSLTGSPDRRAVWVQAALDDYGEGFSTDEVLCEVDLFLIF